MSATSEPDDRSPLLRAAGVKDVEYSAATDLSAEHATCQPTTADQSENVGALGDNNTNNPQLISVGMAIIFVIGGTAGAGFLALPRALADTGWSGITLLVAACLASVYMGRELGNCWNILRERYPEYRGHFRYPYPAIGQRACGAWMRYVISISNNATIFGAATVYLLMSSQNMQSLLAAANVHISFCYWILLIGAVLVPLTWFGTPKDFGLVAIGAMTTVIVSCLLLLIQPLLDASRGMAPLVAVSAGPTTASGFCSALGVISFAFGGTGGFPTIQNDMKEPKSLPRAVNVAYSVMLVIYLAVALTYCLVYGYDVNANALQSMPNGPMRIACEVLMTCHLLFAFIIMLNPLEQELEDLFSVPHEFGWRRCLMRAILVGCISFLAESMPYMNALLSLFGGSTLTFLTYIAPGIAYIGLCRQKGNWPTRSITLRTIALIVTISVAGVVWGVAATISALRLILSPSTFVPPCYVNITAAGM